MLLSDVVRDPFMNTPKRPTRGFAGGNKFPMYLCLLGIPLGSLLQYLFNFLPCFYLCGSIGGTCGVKHARQAYYHRATSVLFSLCILQQGLTMLPKPALDL